MTDLNAANILILSTHGYEQSELFEPLKKLKEAGATVNVATPDGNAIKGWKDGDWVSTTKVKNNKWHHVALVLDGDNKLQPNALTAYLDGNRVGTTDGTQLWSRGDKLGLGNTGGSTRFADGTFGRQQEGLPGGLDQLQIFNDALSASQVRQLSNSPLL